MQHRVEVLVGPYSRCVPRIPPVIELDDFPLRRHNLQSCLADGHLLAQFILAEKSA
jgi:hypothetical protein